MLFRGGGSTRALGACAPQILCLLSVPPPPKFFFFLKLHSSYSVSCNSASCRRGHTPSSSLWPCGLLTISFVPPQTKSSSSTPALLINTKEHNWWKNHKSPGFTVLLAFLPEPLTWLFCMAIAPKPIRGDPVLEKTGNTMFGY